jgi:hypothetical protein
LGFDQLGQAEVEDVRIAGIVDEDVARLEISVDDGADVRGLNRGGDALDEAHRVADGHGSGADGLVEAVAADEIHDVVEVAGGRGPAVVDGDDAWVAEVGEQADLAGEAGLLLGIGQRAVAEDLDGDAPVG